MCGVCGSVCVVLLDVTVWLVVYCLLCVMLLALYCVVLGAICVVYDVLWVVCYAMLCA